MTTTEFIAVRAKAVCETFSDSCSEGSESALAAREAGVFTRTVAPKTGKRWHHEIVAPTEEAARLLAFYVGLKARHFEGMVRDGSGGDWSETREIMAKRDAFARAHRHLAHLDAGVRR